MLTGSKVKTQGTEDQQLGLIEEVQEPPTSVLAGAKSGPAAVRITRLISDVHVYLFKCVRCTLIYLFCPLWGVYGQMCDKSYILPFPLQTQPPDEITYVKTYTEN